MEEAKDGYTDRRKHSEISISPFTTSQCKRCEHIKFTPLRRAEIGTIYLKTLTPLLLRQACAG